MEKLLEEALMDGEIVLKKRAEQCEESAEHDHLSWEQQREWYHRAGRYRLEARRLRAEYDRSAREDVLGTRRL